jgi:dTDP-4-dehydrorhamnose 3,5-epimerase-like enzyme
MPPVNTCESVARVGSLSWLESHSIVPLAGRHYIMEGSVSDRSFSKTLVMDPKRSSPLSAVKLINLPQRVDERGGLAFIEAKRHIPFEIRRVYYLFSTSAGSHRGAHAHKALHQLIVAVAGRFDVMLDDGSERSTYHLTSPTQGLYVAPMVWRDLSAFSLGAVCLVLASEYYTEDDYIRDYAEYRRARGIS